MKRRPTPLLVGLLGWVQTVVGFVATEPLIAQEVELVSTSASCSDCRIVVDTVARLAAREGPGILADETLLEIDSRGRLFALDFVTAPGAVLAFDTEGRHLATIGRPGDGPGEFRMPWGFVRDAEMIAVFDRRRGIIAWIGPDLTLRKTVRFVHPVRQVIRLSEELWVANSFIGHPDVAGHLYHLIRAPDYELSGSFGQEGMVDLERDPTWVRHLARESDSSFWASPKNLLRLELWTATGQRTRILEYDAEWFDPGGWVDVTMDQPYTRRPFPEVSAIQRDQCGFVWVFTWIAAMDWEPIPDPGSWIEAETQRQYDTRVTVIDPSTLRVVAESVIPAKLRSMSEERTFYAYSRESASHPVYDIGRLSFTGSSPQGGVECSSSS